MFLKALFVLGACSNVGTILMLNERFSIKLKRGLFMKLIKHTNINAVLEIVSYAPSTK